MNTQPDKIDHYLRNEMSPAASKDFEKLISEDPSLRAEVDFQQNVIKGLQEYRKTQLKSRLAQIEVSPTHPLWQSGFTKLAGVASVAAIVGLGFIFLTNDSQEEETNLVASGGPVNVAIPSAPDVTDLATIEIEEVTPRTVSKKEQVRVEAPITKEVVEETEPAKAFKLAVDVPDDQKIEEEQGFEAPGIKEELVEIEGEATKRQLEVEQKPTEDDKLSYRYFGGKLSLYGDFSGNPYEILEINTNKGRAVYLYFESQYYALAPSNEIVELSILDDQEVIEQLEIIRSEK